VWRSDLLVEGVRALYVPAMKLKLTRTGGFAGISPAPVEVNTASLAKNEAQRIETLVSSSHFFDLSEIVQSAKPQPDRFQYSLEVTTEDGRRHAIICDEEAAPEPLRQLIHAVQGLKQK